ncbi:hypothetical protein K8W59_11860 [Nocardioides rotundus]|uniref:PPA1309 family protein n=1 Tax=Nocardioides rotundus TaxID=1774216 RepID=UPI001CBD17FA|nr:PPA1309 family protein [Nocardioides rotundus]UAL28566.1 hypothetical protein K8W59_11860 [Nocardioides rotundus]
MTEQGDEQRPLQAEFALEAALREVEAHVASGGWDQPARLYALVPTADLLMREPGLAEALGIEGDLPAGHLTPVEQELPADGEPLETVLQSVEWPAAVRGCAAVLERLVLPPDAEDNLPDEAGAAAEFAAEHPDRQEVRIAAGALRGGTAYSVLRLRSHDDDRSVVGGADLVPALLDLLAATLTEEPPA